LKRTRASPHTAPSASFAFYDYLLEWGESVGETLVFSDFMGDQTSIQQMNMGFEHDEVRCEKFVASIGFICQDRLGTYRNAEKEGRFPQGVAAWLRRGDAQAQHDDADVHAAAVQPNAVA
jgi:hypothetical protein